jgi:Ca-activated chloride channel family protein
MFSISFANPLVLFLLPLPALLAMWIWRRQSGRVVLPLDHSTASTGRRLGFVVNLAETLPAVLLAVVIVILAGPQKLSEPRTKRSLTNIEFCVDISGSMTAPFGDGSRYDGSMKAIDEFLDFRDGDAFGLTFFGNNVLHWVPLTSDTSAVRCAPPFMRPETAPPWFGGTLIGKALIACKEVLTEREEGDRMIVLVSDGASADLSGGADERIARDLARSNIVVYAIHISETEVPPPIVNITSITGGAVFAPGDPEGLKQVFQRIDGMQETRLEKTAAETLDDFPPYCLAGLIVLALGLVTSFGLRYTPW